MNVTGLGALSAYTYQSTLSQTGSADQALSQALAASQSQAQEAGTLFSGNGSVDPLLTLSAASGTEGLSALTYSASAALGQGSDTLQAMLRSTAATSSLSDLFSSSNSPSSLSAAVLEPSATAALVRYTYDQNQKASADPTQTASDAVSQALASGQQTLMASGLNLLA